jgi:hypothetical protein
VPFAYLDDATLLEVQQAALQLGFASESQLAALNSGIPGAFIASAMEGGTSLARLITLTNKMNTTRVLVSGEVPLTRWLHNAVLLAGGAPQELVFRKALERCSTDGAAPATSPLGGPADAPTLDVAALPVGDTGLEIVIEEDDTLDVGFLHQGSAASRSVAKLLVHRHFNGVPSMLAGNRPDLGKGTGWMLAPRLLITNHHVINARIPQREPPAQPQDFDLQGTSVKVLFDFHHASSKPTETTSVACVASDPTLDFALLRLPDDAPDRPPLRLRPAPITKPQDRALQERVNVLQHPNGDPMRLGFRNNFVVAGTEAKLSYLTDTAGGSSGSPICDDAWFVAALHRGWLTISDGPVMVWGRPISQENYGTPIGMILQHLADNHPNLRSEVDAGQAALPDS